MDLLQQYLIEQNLLNESLDDAYAFYKDKLAREQFDEIIAVDPTFDAAQDKLGTYGKWLLASFLKGRLVGDNFHDATEVLNDFEERKRYIATPGGKDINKYKTLEEIRDALSAIELTDNQRAKLARKAKHYADLDDQAEFVVETDKWEVWIPKTYAADCKLGSGTTWCTASTGSNGERYFHNYTDKWGERRGNTDEVGVLYVFLNKIKTQEKFQAQVVFKDGRPINVPNFMNENDRHSIDFDEFIIQEQLVRALAGTSLASLPDVKTGIKIQEVLSSGELKVESLNVLRDTKINVAGMELKTSMLRVSYTDELGKTRKKLNPSIKRIISTTDTYLEEKVLKGNDSIEEIIFEDTVKIKTIPEEAFKGCVALKHIKLPNSLINIDKEAFSGCSSLKELFLPDNVRYIGFNAFYGCKQLKITFNKRTKKNKIQVPTENLDMLKKISSYTNNNAAEEASDEEVSESLKLDEAFSATMPEWLKAWLRKNKANKDNRVGNGLRLALSNGTDTNNNNEYKAREYNFNSPSGKFIDLQRAKFYSIGVPTSPRDTHLREPFLPIYRLGKYDTEIKDGVSTTILLDEKIYIPGVNDYDYYKYGKSFGEFSKTALLDETIDFCYLDLREEENFIDPDKLTQRKDSKNGEVKRFNKARIKDIEKQNKEIRFYGGEPSTVIDKSGYLLDPAILIKKLNLYHRQNYANAVKSYYERLNEVRKALQKELSYIDIKNKRYDEEKLQAATKELFETISLFRTLKDELDSTLKLKDKEKLLKTLDSLFPDSRLGSNYINNTFEGLRKKIVKLEQDLRSLQLSTLEL